MQPTLRCARAGRLLGLSLCFALLAACSGGGPKGNEYVQYKGKTLVVEGTSFEREASLDPPGTYLPGRIVIQPDAGQDDDALALVQRYGLTLEGRSAQGWLLVKGPEGYETQWASALQSQLGGRSTATLDTAQSPTPIAAAERDDAEKATEDAGSGAPVPDAEPSAADVRRIAFDIYERLEKDGGLPATMTATGQSMVIHAKVFDARKESCRRLPQAKPGEWECEAELMMALCTGNCDPSDEEPLPKGERLPVRWDAKQARYVSGY